LRISSRKPRPYSMKSWRAFLTRRCWQSPPGTGSALMTRVSSPWQINSGGAWSPKIPSCAPPRRHSHNPWLKRSPLVRLRPGQTMNLQNFFAELKRRNVYKVAVAYIVAGWALSQGIAQVFPVFDVLNWIIRLIVLLIILGLPIALVLAWMFEITPQGIKRTETADAMPAAARKKKHAWIYVVVIGAAISIGLFF